MKAGNLKHTATLQRITPGDDFGATDDSTATLRTFYCSLRPASGKEVDIAQQSTGLVTHVIEWRWDQYTQVAKPADQIVIGSRTFEIASVYDVDERQRWLRAYVTERVD